MALKSVRLGLTGRIYTVRVYLGPTHTDHQLTDVTVLTSDKKQQPRADQGAGDMTHLERIALKNSAKY